MRNLLKVMTISLVSALTALPAAAETLSDAMVSAYRNSGLLEAQRATLRAADEGVASAVAALRPAIQFSLNWGANRSRVIQGGTDLKVFREGTSLTAELAATMPLIDFGRGQLAIDMAHDTVLATRQDLVAVEQQVLLAAVQAYVDVQLKSQIVELRRSNVRLITQELRAAQDRFEVGEITRTDVSFAEAALAAARAGLAAAEGQLSVAREAYKAATGHYPGQLAALPKAPALPKSMDEARNVAVKRHPQILAAQHKLAAAEKGVQAAKAETMPSIGLTARINNSDSFSGGDDTLTGSVGIGLNQTIYAGGKLASAHRRAVANKQAAAAGLRQTVVSVEQAIGNLWANLAVYDASIAATRQQIEAAQAAFNGVREEANLGARTTLDVLDAEQDLLDARADRLEAEANRYVAVYQMLSSMGLLTAEHLKLGVPSYDPAGYYNTVKNAPVSTLRGKKLDAILEKYGK